MLSGDRNLFDRMLGASDDERSNHFIHSIIFEGDPAATGGAGYDLDEVQSQDGRGEPFTPSAFDQAGMEPAFMQDQVSLDLDLLDHVFPGDYGLEEEDEVDIGREPFFEDEIATQTIEAFRALQSCKVQHEGKSFDLSHCLRIIKDEEEFKLQYVALTAQGEGGSLEGGWGG
ncbi:DNA repair protein rhp54 [Hordeum vulgare]|nr:DNA repair protein rhp54 [Hordeum vulgare]